MKRTTYILIATLLCFNLVRAQVAATNSGGKVNKVQPKIMVIPYAKEGENLRTVLDDDFEKRQVISAIKEAFDARGFTTVDFVAKLKQVKESNAINMGNQSDFKTQILQNSGADIYVEAEVHVDKSSNGNQVRIILQAYEISTGNSLANTNCSSDKWFTEDIGKLSNKALDKCLTNFLNTMQTKFDDIVENGKSVVVEIRFDQGSASTMSSPMGPDKLPLSDNIEAWMEKAAYKNTYHIEVTTDLMMKFDDVRVPLLDQATGKNYNTNKFALEIYKYLQGLGLSVGKDTKSSTIIMTIK